MEFGGQVQKASMIFGGVFNIMGGAKTIDVGFQDAAVLELQGQLQESWANVNVGTQNLSTIEKQREGTTEEFSNMLNQFGASAEGIAAIANALA